LKLTLVDGDVCITENNQTNSLQQQHCSSTTASSAVYTLGQKKPAHCMYDTNYG